ncbi:hypothetical protein AHF37_07361 [Paragonimus kellicotti]|nr:hypothetical protein AHF37_07361 [Paragonimus kellicotti]
MDLTTEEALVRLRNSLRHFEHIKMSKALIGSESVFSFPGHESLLLAFYASSSVMLLVAYFLGLDSLNYFTVSVLLSLLVATSLVTLWLIRRRNDITHNHLSYDVTKLCKDLDRTLQLGFNRAIFYPQFNIPSYLGSSLQWAIRDGETVAVPHILLVQGDIILLTPGQVIPTECVPVNPIDVNANSTFFSNSIYSPKPSTPINHKQDSQLSLELPHHPVKAMVTLSPLVEFMKQHKMSKPSAHNQFAPNLYSFITLILSWSLITSLSMELNTGVSAAAWVKSVRSFTSCVRTFWSEFCVSPDVNVQHSLLMLGAVSSVCCVDQEGILSRPVPTPEKIFFFHKRHHHHHRHHHHQLRWSHWNMSQPGASVQKAREASVPNPSVAQRSSRAGFEPPLPDPLSPDGGRCSIASHHDLQDARPLVSPFEYRSSQVASFSSYSEDRCLLNEAHTSQLVPVVLDLRTDAYWPYLTHFEKPRWSRYMTSLKPLGLCLMLNNCHSSVAHARNAVANHVLARGSHFSNTSTQPDQFGLLSFCLCSLARQIGFRPGAVDGFVSCGCVAGYQIGPQPDLDWPRASQIEESNILYTGDARSYIDDDQWICPQGSCTARVCFSAIFHNRESTGGCHLMSQGGGGLLSSLCTDLWDGKDVSPLREPERCALLDFSNRNASAAYCLGLAYAPLLERPKLCSVSTQPTQDGSFRKDWSRSGDGAVMDTVLLRIPKGYIPHKKINTGRTPSTTGTYCRLCIPQSGPTSAQFLSESPVPQSHSAPFFSTRSNHTNGLTEGLDDPVPLNRSSTTGDVENLQLFSVPHNTIDNVGVNDRRSFRSVPAGRGSCPVERLILDASLDPLSRNDLHECEDLYGSETPCKSWQRAYSFCESVRNEMNLKDNSQSLHKLEKSQEGTCGSDSTTGVEEAQSLLENQIFLGLVSLQYQVNAHVVDTIQRLGQSCIRFVYFSRENELRSRVFAERLGLECGWNCHISLASPTTNVYSRKSSANTEAGLRKRSSGTSPVRAGLLSTLRMYSDHYLSRHVDQPVSLCILLLPSFSCCVSNCIRNFTLLFSHVTLFALSRVQPLVDGLSVDVGMQF